MKVTILGTGNVGTHIGNALLKLKCEVIYGSRDPKKAKVPTGAKVSDLSSSVKDSDMIFLAVPGARRKEIINSIGNSAFKGKIVVDVTNVVTKNDDWAFGFFGVKEPLEGNLSGAEEIAKLLPDSKIVKAFNTVFAGFMDKGSVKGEKLALFIAGDDKSAKEKIAEIGKGIGFEPVDVGPLKLARHLEAMGLLMIKISADDNWKNTGFRVVKESK